MGWEMGGGLGHVVPLLAVARGLREHGHRPVLALRDVVEPAFPQHHVYVYFGAELPGVKALIDGLGQAGLPATVYLREAPPEALRRLERPGLRFLDAPPPYEDILPRCSVAVHYGSLGTAAACLAAGRPQLSLPRQVERRLTARALDKLGVGLTIPGNFTAGHFASSLLKTVNHPALAANAAALAAGLERPAPGDVLKRIVERCLALIGET